MPSVSIDPGQPPPRAARFDTIELGRGLAALAVVLFHANASARQFGGPNLPWLTLGEHGVDFFFVLSGFIIFTAHGDDIGRPGAGRPYALKRAIRLLPLLWLVVGGFAALHALGGDPPGAGTTLRSLLPWPSLEVTLPRVVWTLRHEILFYLAFLVLIARPRIGRALFLGWGLATLAQGLAILLGRPAEGVAALFLSSYTLDFLLGAAVAGAWRHGHIPRHWGLLAGALLALGAALAAEHVFALRRLGAADYTSPIAFFWTLLLGALFAAVLAGLTAIEARVRVPRAGVLLGGASYAVYLVHTPVNSVAQRLAAHLPRALLALGAGHLLLILLGVAAGVLLHLVVERPLTRNLRRRLLPRTERTAAIGLDDEARTLRV